MTARAMILWVVWAGGPAWAAAWDEAVDGELSASELAATDLGVLAGGDHVVVGRFDNDQDSFTFELAPGFTLGDASVEVVNYLSLGGVAFRRWFQPSPYQLGLGGLLTGDGVYVAPPGSAAGFSPIGFTLAPSGAGALFDYEVRIRVDSTCQGGAVLWNEEASGDIVGDEVTPAYLGSLAPGTYVVCGRVDPGMDAFELGLDPGMRITSTDVEVSGYRSLGQDGFVRFFRRTPFLTFDSAAVAADGAYVLDPTTAGSTDPVGFTAASLGPSGATFDYRAVFVVEDVRPKIEPLSAPAAGATVRFELSDLTPGGQVYLAASALLGSTPIAACPGLASELRSPRVVASGLAGRTGTYTATVTLPATLAGRTVHFQAFDPAACQLSALQSYPL